MTPKEKAEDILDKCYGVEVESVYFGVNHYLAKKFALIVVDEIINDWINNFKKLKEDETIEIKHSLNEMMELSHSMKYWKEVKQEIEK